MSARKEFSKAVKVARLKHATVNGVIFCEGCGVMIKPGQLAFDHDDPDKMTGEPTFDNCRVLCADKCHAAKTAVDVERIARAKRQEAAAAGIRAEAGRPIETRGFAKKPKRAPREALPPKRLYQRIGS